MVKLYRLKHTDDELFYSQWDSLWIAKSVSPLCVPSFDSLSLCLILNEVVFETIGSRSEGVGKEFN